MGYLEGLKALSKNFVGHVDVLVAALGGHLETLKWASENGCPWDEETCANAMNGHLHVSGGRVNDCP